MPQPQARVTAQRAQISRLEDHLGYWLRFVSNHVSARFRRLVEANGVTVSDWVAMRLLYGANPLSSGALIEALGMTKGAVSKLVDRLEHKRLIRRSPDLADGRVQRISLTATGRRLVPRLAALADENDTHFFGDIAPETRGQLAALLRQLVERHALTQVPTE